MGCLPYQLVQDLAQQNSQRTRTLELAAALSGSPDGPEGRCVPIIKEDFRCCVSGGESGTPALERVHIGGWSMTCFFGKTMRQVVWFDFGGFPSYFPYFFHDFWVWFMKFWRVLICPKHVTKHGIQQWFCWGSWNIRNPPDCEVGVVSTRWFDIPLATFSKIDLSQKTQSLEERVSWRKIWCWKTCWSYKTAASHWHVKRCENLRKGCRDKVFGLNYPWWWRLKVWSCCGFVEKSAWERYCWLHQRFQVFGA